MLTYKIKKTPYVNEWHCRAYVNGIRDPQKDYFADSLDDAKHTVRCEIARATTILDLRTDNRPEKGKKMSKCETCNGKPTEYKAIALWGKYTGSYQYYIENQQNQAALDNAPISAIYRNQDGTWSTVDEVKNVELKAWLQNA